MVKNLLKYRNENIDFINNSPQILTKKENLIIKYSNGHIACINTEKGLIKIEFQDKTILEFLIKDNDE